VSPSSSGIRPCHTHTGPVFVLGHARSGTSLLCRLLLDHLGVNFGTESQFIVRYYQKRTRYGDLGHDANLRRLFEDLSRERFFARTRQNFGFVFDAEQALRSVRTRTYDGALRAVFGQFAASQGAVRWGDKTPDYCHHLDVIHELFPDAQFLHVVRDGRAVASSSFKTGFGPKNAFEAALAWKKALGQIRRFRDTLPAHAFAEIHYERLVDDPVATLEDIAGFLGIQNREEVVAAVAPALRAQVRVGTALKWKQELSWREIECFEAYAREELESFGYTPLFRPRTKRQGAAEQLFWQAQAAWRRLGNRRYWSDNWYKLGLRLTDATAGLLAVARPRHREVWPTRGVRS
jgi:hypothetical protein